MDTIKIVQTYVDGILQNSVSELERVVMWKLDTLVADFPDTYRLTEQDEISKTYSLPKSHVSYRKPRAASTGQRERARQMMIAKNKAKAV